MEVFKGIRTKTMRKRKVSALIMIEKGHKRAREKRNEERKKEPSPLVEVRDIRRRMYIHPEGRRGTTG